MYYVCIICIVLYCIMHVYMYVCNAGTGNGTTNPTAGQLAINIEYYGVEN